jgi:hypothetical protein
MTLATTYRAPLAPSPGKLSPRQARSNVAAAFAKLEDALAAQERADDDAADRRAANAATDAHARAVLEGNERRRDQNATDLWRERMKTFAAEVYECGQEADRRGEPQSGYAFGRLHGQLVKMGVCK